MPLDKGVRSTNTQRIFRQIRTEPRCISRAHPMSTDIPVLLLNQPHLKANKKWMKEKVIEIILVITACKSKSWNFGCFSGRWLFVT